MTISGKDRGGGEFAHYLDNSGTAGSTVLASIVARSRRRSERRLKVVTAASIVAALAGASVAGVIGTRASTTSALPPKPSNFAKNLVSGTTSSKWATQRRVLGAAPKGLGWSRSSTSSASASVPAASSSASGATALCTVNGCGGAVPTGNFGALNRLFARSSGDVTIRAFSATSSGIQLTPGSTNASSPPSTGTTQVPTSIIGNTGGAPVPVPSVYESCLPTQELVVEVANPGAVGTLSVPLPPITISSPTQSFEVVDSAAVGVAEGSPIEVLTLHVGANVASVQATFPDGSSDQMSVVDGWAVLVDDGASPLPATVEAMDSSGNIVSTASVNSADALAEPERCLLPIEPLGQIGSGTARATTGSK
jgi:hypothetical protein